MSKFSHITFLRTVKIDNYIKSINVCGVIFGSLINIRFKSSSIYINYNHMSLLAGRGYVVGRGQEMNSNQNNIYSNQQTMNI